MPIATIIGLIASYGPDVIPLVQQVVAWVESGKTTVTSADLAILAGFGSKKAAAYLPANFTPVATAPAPGS